MNKIITVVGARPQFIKASAVSRIIRDHSQVEEIIIHTGQHFDENMSSIFFEELEISKPDFNLGISSSNHGEMTGRQLEAIEKILLKEMPSCVMVYGDTNSTLAGALAASKLKIPIVHVEAGLRSFNKDMPEEVNRILTDHVSDTLFTPSEIATANLIKEGISNKNIFNVGDVMFDASIFFKNKAREPEWIKDINKKSDKFVLATVHRAENTDNLSRLENIFNGLSESPIPVIIPLHPRTKLKLSDSKINLSDQLHIVDPVGYLEMIWLESNCELICTDSGGVQKEAYFFKKPCITMRDETEWVELIESGWNILVGASKEKIINGISNFKTPSNYESIYGDGNSSQLIVNQLSKIYK